MFQKESGGLVCQILSGEAKGEVIYTLKKYIRTICLFSLKKNNISWTLMVVYTFSEEAKK